MATVWTTVIWMGSDMYLPALPVLGETFPVPEAVINLTLLSFSVALPFGSLIGGPLSDRLGRLGPTLGGGGLYALANVVCALAPTIEVLIVVRALAGLGGGVIAATTMAIIKDSLEGAELDRAITMTQSFAAVGPIAAPFIGSFMLAVTSWRGVFVVLAVLAALCLLWTLRIGETLPVGKRADVHVMTSVGLVWKVGRNPSFMVLLLVLSAPALSWGVYMTLCPYAYIDFFGMSNLVYSVFYGLTCAISIIGPFVFLFLHKRLSDRVLVWLFLVLLGVSGALVATLGTLAPVAFFLTCVPFFLAESMSRPYAYLVLMRAAPDNAGSASALITFVMAMFVAVGTPIASLPFWPNYVVGTGLPFVGVAVIAAVLLVVLVRVIRSDILDQSDEESAD